MMQAQIKIRLKTKQEAKLEEWLLILTRVWNWSISKIERGAKEGVYFKKSDFQNILSGHGKRLDIPSHTLQGMLCIAWDSWQKCFKKIAKKPKFKGKRNKLNSIPFPDPIRRPDGVHIKLPGIGILRFHKQDVPEGKIKCGRLIKRASGWYLCLFIDAKIQAIGSKGSKKIGVDPGFKNTLTLSTGEKIDKLKRFKDIEKRLAQAQRGRRKKLVSRIQERIKNGRKDDNHKLSRSLVEQCDTIVFSKDNIRNIAKSYGKSVAESGHYQLRKMISYKCIASSRNYIEVDSKYSTMTCSLCLAKTGATGKAGLSVRQWLCSGCGTQHDRDVNAATNTLIAGLGMSLERCA